VSFLCASRPRHPYVSSLEARDGDFVQLDLDASDSAADNDATVRTFWEGAAGPLGLDAGFVDKVVARAGGNVQHAVQLRRYIAATPAQLRRARDIPRSLGALIDAGDMLSRFGTMLEPAHEQARRHAPDESARAYLDLERSGMAGDDARLFAMFVEGVLRGAARRHQHRERDAARSSECRSARASFVLEADQPCRSSC